MADFDSSLPVRTENDGDVVVKVSDGSVPSQKLGVDSSGRVTVKIQDSTGDSLDSTGGALHVHDGGGSLTVDANNLDIRDLSASQDNVAISDGTDTLAVNNDGSINAVVSATDLDIRDLSHTQDSVRIGDGTDLLAVNNDGSINAVVSATDLDIRNLSHTQDSVVAHIKDSSGNNITDSNPLPVYVAEDPGTEVVNYNTAASIAKNASSNHDYTVASGAKLYQIWASSSGKMRIEVRVETAPSSNVFNTVAVGFNSTANPNIDLKLSKHVNVVSGARVRVVRTNLDNPTDLYSTIVVVES